MNRSFLPAALTTCVLLAPHAGFAASYAGAAGIESFLVPGGSGSRAVLGIGAVEFGRADMIVQGMRFDDDVTGTGWSFMSGAGVTLEGPLRARVRATRTMGDGTFRSWQWRAGPELRLGRRASVGAYYEAYAAGDSARTQGVTGEALVAMTRKLTGHAASGWARDATGDTRVVQATLGGIWHALPHLDLNADAGWVSLDGTTTQGFPDAGTGSGLPLLGGGHHGSASRTDVTRQRSATLLLGARVIFP
jgi:hypothetical protein